MFADFFFSRGKSRTQRKKPEKSLLDISQIEFQRDWDSNSGTRFVVAHDVATSSVRNDTSTGSSYAGVEEFVPVYICPQRGMLHDKLILIFSKSLRMNLSSVKHDCSNCGSLSWLFFVSMPCNYSNYCVHADVSCHL